MIPPKEKTKSKKMLLANIKYLKNISGLSVINWSGYIRISHQTVRAWFEGRVIPQTPHLVKISNKLKISIDYLVRKDLSKLPNENITANYMFIQKMMKL